MLNTLHLLFRVSNKLVQYIQISHHNYHTLQSSLQKFNAKALFDDMTSRAHHLPHDCICCDGFFRNYLHFVCRCPPCWRGGSRLDCGVGDLGSIPGIPSPRVGPLLGRRLSTSSDVRCQCRGRLGGQMTPICPWRWVPGSRSKFENRTAVPSLYSWNIGECDVKPQQTKPNRMSIIYRHIIQIH